MTEPEFGDVEIRDELRKLVEREKNEVLAAAEKSVRAFEASLQKTDKDLDNKLHEYREKIELGRKQTLKIYEALIDFLNRD